MRLFILAVVLAGLVGSAPRADEADPEPPGAPGQLGQLKGKWTMTRLLFKGKEIKPPAAATYAFDGKKLTIEQDGRQLLFKVKLDTRKKPFIMEWTDDKTRRVQTGIYKVENGELFLTAATSTSFDGNTGVVTVLAAQKK